MANIDERKSTSTVARFRLDVTLHETLMNSGKRSMVPPPAPGQEMSLPELIFPRYPELLSADDEQFFPKDGERHWTAGRIVRAMNGWAVPYLRSRVMPGEFHPTIAYLFNEWKCNLDCHYCWAFENSVKGMPEETMRRSIDWLHDMGCRRASRCTPPSTTGARLSSQNSIRSSFAR